MDRAGVCSADPTAFPTWLPVALFHPDVAVVLGHPGLRVQEGHAHAALGTETGIVAAAVFDSLPVELVAEPEHRQTVRGRGRQTVTWKKKQRQRSVGIYRVV